MTRLCKICIQIVSLFALNTFFEEEVTFRIQWMYLITKASVKQRNRYGCVCFSFMVLFYDKMKPLTYPLKYTEFNILTTLISFTLDNEKVSHDQENFQEQNITMKWITLPYSFPKDD